VECSCTQVTLETLDYNSLILNTSSLRLAPYGVAFRFPTGRCETLLGFCLGVSSSAGRDGGGVIVQ